MGTRRIQRLSDAEICRLYAANESRELICRKAGLWDSELLGVLARNGVVLRTPEERKALQAKRRHCGTLRLTDSVG